MIENFEYKLPDNEKIRVTAYSESGVSEAGCLIYVHGFKGFKDWGFVPSVGNYFAERGYLVLTFNFSLNGIGENPYEFTEFDKFSRNTISREVEELGIMINLASEFRFGKFGKEKIGLIGHSRGGGVSIICSAENAKVHALCTWASVATFDRYSSRIKDEWIQNGFFEVQNMRTGQVFRMSSDYITEIIETKQDELNIINSVSKIECPYLIIHGEQDLAVPVKEGKQLYSAPSSAQREFIGLPATGHTFDIVHPFEGISEKFLKVLTFTEQFFKSKL